MTRRWHLERSDGSEWTDGELDVLVDDSTPIFLVDMQGRPWVGEMTTWGGQFDPCPDEYMEQLDMKVVWDD